MWCHHTYLWHDECQIFSVCEAFWEHQPGLFWP
jgi:hypothetical protein